MQSERRIILVGKTGNGKSSTGNSILQKEAFIQKTSLNAVTKTCLMKSGMNSSENIRYHVVDTPGLLFRERNVSEREHEIQRSVEICPEPHAFLIVLSANNRLTTDERFIIKRLRTMFGDCIFNHSIVVFTHSNKFVSEFEFQQFWGQNAELVNLIRLCGNRVAKIENNNDFLTENEGTRSILEMIEIMSDAGETVYRYTDRTAHRSVLGDHSETTHGQEDIHEDDSEMVENEGETTGRMYLRRMLYVALIGGGAFKIGYLAGNAKAAAAGPAVLNTTVATGRIAAKRFPPDPLLMQIVFFPHKVILSLIAPLVFNKPVPIW